MTRKTLACASLLALLAAGCTELFSLIPLFQDASVKLVIHNDSATRYVSPNPGLCPQGLEVQTHSFLAERPVISPGGSVTITTLDIGGLDGLCADADPSFMVGFCGWQHGEDPDSLSACTLQYGGQIGFQFNCGDTIVLRWTDEGGPDGIWTSEVIPQTGNPAPQMPFQLMEGGGACTQ